MIALPVVAIVYGVAVLFANPPAGIALIALGIVGFIRCLSAAKRGL